MIIGKRVVFSRFKNEEKGMKTYTQDEGVVIDAYSDPDGERRYLILFDDNSVGRTYADWVRKVLPANP